MTRLLVTGASGLLGSNIVLEAMPEIAVTAAYNTHPVPFHGADQLQADLSDPEPAQAVFLQAAPDWVIHCAAGTAVEALARDPDRAQRLNVEMSRNVARAAFRAHARLLHVSTDSVFDGRQGPYSEQDKPAPINEYARSKLQGEAAVLAEHPAALVVRTNLFGHSPTGDRSLAEWFLHRLTEGYACPGFEDVFFSPAYVRDLAQLFLTLLRMDAQGLLHVPGDECISKYDFGVRIARIFSLDPQAVEPQSSTAAGWSVARPLHTCLASVRLTNEFGLKPPSLNGGLSRFYEDARSGYARDLQAHLQREETDA